MRTLDAAKHDFRRQTILDRSRRLFANHGFAETSMSAIGRACRLTKPALYHYFRSKEEILSEIFESHWKQTEDQIKNFPKAKDLPAMLLEVGRAYLKYWEDESNVELCKISMQEGTHVATGKRQGIHWVQPRVDQSIAELFRRYCPASAKPESVKLFAWQFFGALFFFVFSETFHRGGKSLPASREQYLKHLVKIFSQSRS